MKRNTAVAVFVWCAWVLAFFVPSAFAAPDLSTDDADLIVYGMNEYFLASLAHGDFNGDGYLDLAAGAPGT
jgi:hypothetical protein